MMPSTEKLKVSAVAGCSIVVWSSISKRQFQDILDRSEPAKPTSTCPTLSKHTEPVSQGHHKLFDTYMIWHSKLHDGLYGH